MNDKELLKDVHEESIELVESLKSFNESEKYQQVCLDRATYIQDTLDKIIKLSCTLKTNPKS